MILIQHAQGIMLPKFLERNKICSNRTKSFLIIFLIIFKPILSAKTMRILQWDGVLLLHPSFYNIIRLSKTPLKSFVTSS